MKSNQTFLPGDDWVYIRIYTGYRTADKLLIDTLFPAWQKIHHIGLTDTWFFIRYANPDFHLRFRVKMKDDRGIMKLKETINPFLHKLMDIGLVWKVEYGTYHQEIDRYGSGSMKDVEQLFCFDSIAIMNFLGSEKLEEEENLRWLYAMASIDMMLNDFHFNLQSKKDLLLSLSRSFGKEFGKNKQLARQLSSKYRENRIRIAELLSREAVFPDKMIYALLDRRSSDSCSSIGNVLQLFVEGKMEMGIDDLLSSLMHMSLNRIFSNNNRLHEMVLYDLLFRHYKSALITNGILSKRN